MKKLEPWEELTRQLEASLADGASHSEPVIEAEEHLDVGAVRLDIVVEASGPSEPEQRAGFATVCDVLRTRLQQGSSQVLGCLLINGEPSASAFASGLEGMQTEDGFTPVIPVRRDRAKVMLDAKASLFEFVDRATQLIDIAASRESINDEVSATALMEIDELVERSIEESR